MCRARHRANPAGTGSRINGLPPVTASTTVVNSAPRETMAIHSPGGASSALS